MDIKKEQELMRQRQKGIVVPQDALSCAKAGKRKGKTNESKVEESTKFYASGKELAEVLKSVFDE